MDINTLMINKEVLEIVNLDGKIKDLQLYIHVSGEVSVYFDNYEEPLFSGKINSEDLIRMAGIMMAHDME